MNRCYRTIILSLTAGLAAIAAAAQIPTEAERIRDSGLNANTLAWRAEQIRMHPSQHPLPDLGTNGPPLRACFRYDFTLAAKSRQAELAFEFANGEVLYVNGRVAAETPSYGRQGTLKVVDLAPFLRVGTNTLAFEGCSPRDGRMWLAEGIVFGEDGSVTRLLTEHLTWQGGWNLPKGWWVRPEPGAERMKPVAALRRLDKEPAPAHWGSGSILVIPRYFGRIQVAPAGMREPIFDEGKPIELKLTLLNSAPEVGGMSSEALRAKADQKAAVSQPGTKNEEQRAVLTYDVFDENNRKTVGAGTVDLKPEGKLDLAGTLKYGPLPQGAYRVRFILRNGTNEVDRRDYEAACVGEIKQRVVAGKDYEDGLDLKKVWSVDCTAEPIPGEFIAGILGKSFKDAGAWMDIETVVQEGPAGRYRTFAKHQSYIYMAYRYRVERLYTPHLAVIEYPDDGRRSFIAQVMEGTSVYPRFWAARSYGYQRGEGAVNYNSMDMDPRHSNRMLKLYVLFWPNEAEGAIHISNIPEGDLPAGVARLTVYEITNDLPALQIADAGDRLIGPHSERGPQTVASTYYAGPLGPFFQGHVAGFDHPEFYRNWYITTANLIKRQRFSGQNTYFFGQFMYGRTLYPTRAFQFSQDQYIGGDAVRDMAGLMLRMFARNGMSLVSCIEYVCTPDLIGTEPPTEEQIRAGDPTLLWVSKSGSICAWQISPGQWNGWVNFFHPRVQESVLTLVGELADRYKDYPAWKGIAFILDRQVAGPLAMCDWGGRASMARHPDPLDWGYDDFTLNLFQQETGVKVPSFDNAGSTALTAGQGKKDPERFQKRYDWLMANARQPWIDWRCSQYTKLYRRIRDRLTHARPDLTLRLDMEEPVPELAGPTPQGLELDGLYGNERGMIELIKRFGFDVETLRKEPGIDMAYSYPVLSGDFRKGGGHGGRYELTRNDLFQGLFANDGKGGAYVKVGMIHYSFLYPKGKWLWEGSGTRQGYFWPQHMNNVFVNVLVRSNPAWLMHTWMDVADSTGRIQEMREFARAYRSLPNGKYTRLTGNGLDSNVWVEITSAKGAIYGYAANPQWWGLDQVTLTFAGDVAVQDLITGQAVKLKRGKWSFALGPYGVQTFRVDGWKAGDGPAANGAALILPAEAVTAVTRSLVPAEEVVKRAQSREAEMRDRPGWREVEPLKKLISDIHRQKQVGNISEAYDLASSWPMALKQNIVISEALEAIPFLVLGPFGKPEDTEGAGNNLGNPEVVKDYRGMETAFLGESDQADLAALRPDFKPDLMRRYAVYPGRELGWQEMFKTYYLSFNDKASSPHPLWMVAYGFTEVYSPEDRKAKVWAGSEHAVWIWVNGKLSLKHGGAGTHRCGQRPGAPDQDTADLCLNKGWNPVLVKAVQRGEARLYLRLTDRDGKALDDLRYRVPKAG